MPRPKGYNPQKIVKIVSILAKYEEGVWIRKIAAEAGMHPSTVSRYVGGMLASVIIVSELGPEDKKPIMRIVRLKPEVLERLRQGDTIKRVLRFAGLLEKVRR